MTTARRSCFLGRVGALLGGLALTACGTKSPSLGEGDDASMLTSRDDGGDESDASVGQAEDAAGRFQGSADASTPMSPVDAGDGLCTLGAFGSMATDASLQLFGDIVWYNGGARLPAGHYRAQYVDGCMKYDFIYDWMCNGLPGGDLFLVRGDASTDRVTALPCTEWAGFGSSVGSFASFDDCVSANKALPPKDFDFDGGPLGIWLNDFPYDDNVPGVDGRNPKWALTLLEACPPDIREVPNPK
jgi:hypothetical protein